MGWADNAKTEEKDYAFLSAEETIANLQKRLGTQVKLLGLNAGKVTRVRMRADSVMRMVNEVPMNSDRKVKALSDALHDILKIVNESLEEDNGEV